MSGQLTRKMLQTIHTKPPSSPSSPSLSWYFHFEELVLQRFGSRDPLCAIQRQTFPQQVDSLI